jgi:flagellar hook assembly protein FlgD
LINFKAFPNPFSDVVTLAFEHNFEGKNVVATVDIMDLSGHTAKTFTKSYIPQGNREVSITWDGRTDGGEKMASGLYICRIMMQDDQGNQASGCCKIVLVY